MALVSIVQAKQHLRIDTADADNDIMLKVEQASAIVLDYLKGRTLTVDEITSSAGVATVTTIHPHGLTTGDTVIPRGALQPEYNASVVVTVTSASTFTFAVVGSPGSPATGPLAIRAEATWTDVTVPGDVQAMVLLMLGHLYENRGDDMSGDEKVWQAIARLGMRHRDPALA